MRATILTAMALLAAAPAITMAQVGPNPAVSGGSLDPSTRGSADPLTAPQDSRAELPGSGPSVDLGSRPAADGRRGAVRPGGDMPAGAPAAGTRSGPSATGGTTGGTRSGTTTTGTHTGTSPMSGTTGGPR